MSDGSWKGKGHVTHVGKSTLCAVYTEFEPRIAHAHLLRLPRDGTQRHGAELGSQRIAFFRVAFVFDLFRVAFAFAILHVYRPFPLNLAL